MKNILSQVPSEAKIKSIVKKIVFGKKLFCPRCGSPQIKRSENRYRCRLCRKPFSLTSHTWLKGMKISWQDFWLLLWCWTRRVSVDQSTKVSGLSKPTVRIWYEKFRTHLPQDQIDDETLSGVIEMDEAYRGGKKKGYSLIGAKESKDKGKRSRMIIKVVNQPSVDRQKIVPILAQHIEPGSKLWTDGGSIYRGIGNWWPVDHSYERHNRFEFALTSEIEGLWGNLTWFIRRMYHHVTRDQIAPVIREFIARQMYAEWFEQVESVLPVIMTRLARPQRPEWRGKYQIKFSQSKTTISPMPIAVRELSTVPCC